MFERSVYYNEDKTKSKNKNTKKEYRYFLGSNFVWVNSNQDNNAKRSKVRIYYLSKGIIKNYNVIINGKSFYQPIDSDIKLYKEIRKLTKEQGEGYIAGRLLNYEYIKSHYILIAVDLIR